MAEKTCAKVRPLIVRFGAFGDMVVLLSMVRALHQRCDAPVDVISSGTWTGPLLEGQPAIGTVHLIRSRKTPYLFSSDQWRLVRTLRAREPGPVWNCDGERKSRWLIARGGIPASHIVDASSVPFLPNEHVIDRLLRLAALTPPAFESRCSPAQIDPSLSVPPLVVQDGDRREADAWLERHGLRGKPLVLIQAGNKRTTRWWRPRHRETNTKYWPEARWAQIIDAIAALETQAEILLCGVASESKLNQAVLRHVQTRRARDVAGDLPLGRLFALQERAIGMVSVDTGPAQSAAALGAPLVVLFGIADISRHCPRSKTGLVACLRGVEAGRPQIGAITEREVVDAWIAVRHACVPERWRAAS